MDIRLIFKISAFPKLIYRSSCKSNKNFSDLFYRYWKADFRIYVERQRPRIANSILKEKNQVGKLILSTFKTFYKAITHLNWVWARVPKLLNEERTIFSVNSAETTGYLHGKKGKKFRALPLFTTKT